MVPEELKNGLVKDGVMTDLGLRTLSTLLDYMEPHPNLTPGFQISPYGIFEKIMSKTVPTAVELIIVHDGKIFLTWREDKFFHGWHTPGSYISLGETLLQTAQRIADREVPGIKIKSTEIIGGVSHNNSNRFHDFSALVAVEFEGNIKTEGKWFSEEPKDLIEAHKPFWPTIEKLLW